MLSEEAFKKGIEELQVAFPKLEISKDGLKVWYKYSKDLSDGMWRRKIRGCMRHCHKNAPVLADILEAEPLKEEKIEYVN